MQRTKHGQDGASPLILVLGGPNTGMRNRAPWRQMATPLDQQEQFIRDRLEDPDSLKAEALKWLEDSEGRNTLGELSSTQASIDLVKAIYAAGAESVIAIEI